MIIPFNINSYSHDFNFKNNYLKKKIDEACNVLRIGSLWL